MHQRSVSPATIPSALALCFRLASSLKCWTTFEPSSFMTFGGSTRGSQPESEGRYTRRLVPYCLRLSVHGNSLGIVQLSRAAVVILENDLRVRVGHEPILAQFLRHVEDVVHPHYAEVRIEPLQARQV